MKLFAAFLLLGLSVGMFTTQIWASLVGGIGVWLLFVSIVSMFSRHKVGNEYEQWYKK